MVASAASVLTILLLGLIPLLVTGGDAPVADDVVPTTLTESTPTTVAESIPTTLPGSTVPFTWSRVPHDEAALGSGDMLSVTVGGPGLVAVGSDSSSAAVWTSIDGLTWSRVPQNEEVFGIGDALGGGMFSVTARGPGLVAVGHDSEDAAVWTSVDGLVWSRVPHDEAVFGGEAVWPEIGNGAMLSVTAGGPGLVASGMTGCGHLLMGSPGPTRT